MAQKDAPHIYVCERGWVIVGRPQQTGKDALFLHLNDCGIIRRWGTERGLGQLATEGPLPDTVIDPLPGTISIRVTFVYIIIPCSERAWNKWTS